MNINTSNIGRNEPCPCGSNKKYKKCCMQKATSANCDSSRLNQKPEQKLQQAYQFYSSKNYAAAGMILREILSQKPNYYPALFLLGQAATIVGDFETVIMALSHAINIDDTNADCYSMLGYAYLKNDDLKSALNYLNKALSINPKHIIARTNKATCLANSGNTEDAIKEYHYIVNNCQFDHPTWINYLIYQNSIQNISNQQLFDAHKHFGNIVEPNKYAYKNWGDHDHNPNKVIRIGYLSSDFKIHSVAYFIEPILKTHDKSKFEVYCYHAASHSDSMTDTLKDLSSHWRDVSNLSSSKIAELIHMDKIDILIELNGHTTGSRLHALTYKPAPIQVTWIGYPNTTGLTSVDYRITDNITDTEGEADRYYTEQLVRLPNIFLCYSPPKNAPDIKKLPALSNNYITYGSFNSARKITNTLLHTWTNILKRSGNSRLILKTPQLANEITHSWIRNHFKREGIENERLILLNTDLDAEEHLNRYNLIDIGLDTYPYNGTTTTCEALYMGVPVITKMGDNHRSRVGGSLLHSTGLSELIAYTSEDYINLAVNLADNINLLNEYRTNLRQRMYKSALYDASTFTDNLQSAYKNMWEHWCLQHK